MASHVGAISLDKLDISLFRSFTKTKNMTRSRMMTDGDFGLELIVGGSDPKGMSSVCLSILVLALFLEFGYAWNFMPNTNFLHLEGHITSQSIILTLCYSRVFKSSKIILPARFRATTERTADITKADSSIGHMADASANADADMADREAETPQPTVEECCDEPRAAGAVEFSGADAPICVIMLHGNTVDIANTDIDFVLLEALLGAREEVLNHNTRDPRCSVGRTIA
ncbi:hypothetical protein VNI00_013503 [Paramarasmius palmivorus]|uniref:Uncharacterized protein n=1 Tax=Paramarasmius palmivorus TaxID=297713 RepID=A0AAW0BXZ6_9AGAR